MSWHYSTGTSRGGDPYDAAEPKPSDDVEAYDAYLEPDPPNWRWIAVAAGAVLLIAVVGTLVIVTGGDSASTTARIVPSASRPAFTPAPTKPPSASLPSETVTMVTPSRTSTSTAQAAPGSTETTAPPPTSPEAESRTVVYTVSGTKQPFDPVTITYTDETGALRTDFDVTLPWTRTVVMGGNVVLNSVTAVSFASHLNCSITDGGGQPLASQTYNTIAATCNR
ncbi:MAG: hypothetical protein JWR32_6683 [Mycobacterium sp.]|jgi:hypothetical protein|nr:hypothetical protein [Mycobacterium sp.]